MGDTALDTRIARGSYQLRALYSGLDSLSEYGLDGDDVYRVVLWPGPARPLSVVKQWKDGRRNSGACGGPAPAVAPGPCRLSGAAPGGPMTTDSEHGAHGTDPVPVERSRTSPILVVLAGVPILVVSGLAIAFANIPVLLVLGFGGLVGGAVGAVRAHRRKQQADPSTRAHRGEQQADPSTRARSAAAGATVGLLAAVGVSVVGFVFSAIAMGVILLMALSSWR